MRSLKTYFNHKKEFHYFSKIRYAQGVGDVVAAILHSKLIGPITYLVTGKLEPCNTCQNRRTALNFLLPIPFWKIFFSNESIYNEKLNKEFENAQKKLKSESSVNLDNTETKTVDDVQIKKEPSNDIDDIYKDYFLVAENRTEQENILIVNKIYKKI